MKLKSDWKTVVLGISTEIEKNLGSRWLMGKLAIQQLSYYMADQPSNDVLTSIYNVENVLEVSWAPLTEDVGSFKKDGFRYAITVTLNPEAVATAYTPSLVR